MNSTILELLQLENIGTIDAMAKEKLNIRLQILYKRFNPIEWRNNKAKLVTQALNKVDYIINNNDALNRYIKEGTEAFKRIRNGIFVDWDRVREATKIIQRELINDAITLRQQLGKTHNIHETDDKRDTSITNILTGLKIETHRLRKGDVKFLIKTNDYELPRGTWISIYCYKVIQSERVK